MSLHQRSLTWLPLSIVLPLLMAHAALAQAPAATPPASAATNVPTSPTPASAKQPAQAPNAEADDVAFEQPSESVGTQSRQWLRVQAARQQASSTRQTLSGPVMKAVHERYVGSFTAPIEPTSLHNRDAISSN